MTKRKISNTDIEISPFIFGGNVFGWTADEATSFRLLDEFVANGFETIDTANSYSSWVPGNEGGESETIIGKWMKNTGKRNELILITKVGWDITPERKGLDKKSIMEEVEGSLKRLQTDHIDIYLSHKDDPATPVEETLEAYDQLIKQGKVRQIGSSNLPVDRLAESIETSQEKKLYEYKLIQPKYNLYDRLFEESEAKVAEDYSLGVISYSSLASGFLSGKYKTENDFKQSVRGYGMKNYLNEKGFALLNALEKLSLKHDAAYSTLALAWLLHKPVITAPIASATSSEQLKELMASVSVKLDKEDMALLDAAGSLKSDSKSLITS
ncbi:MAG: aldo/keto reductase [Ginsengibacter sp.]